MSRVWVKTDFGIIASNKQEPYEFTPGIYTTCFSERIGCFLKKDSDSFPTPNKIYDLDQKFIEKVLKQFSLNDDKNLGVLLCGLKGTGKTFTAKMIANQSGLPVITVMEAYPGIDSFIADINFDCVIMIDEYEKVFAGDARGILLSCMDGVQSPKSKVMFLLTTNTLDVNDNLIDRPSRIRYLKRYEGLSKEIINDIVDDLLVNKSFKENLIETISEIPNITIDIIMEIIKDTNNHNENPSDFIDIFNCNSQAHSSNYATFDIWTKNEDGKHYWGKNLYLDFKFDADGFDPDEPYIVDNLGFQICKIVEYTSKRSARVEWILKPKFYEAVRQSYFGRGAQKTANMWDKVQDGGLTAEQMLEKAYEEEEEEVDEVESIKKNIEDSKNLINFTGDRFIRDIEIFFGPHTHKNFNFRTPNPSYIR
jgi:SpoVK/Ycf46/Vps4 family AAA+-type ATPase